MPKAWVKDYFKHILVDAAESWILAKHKASGTNREEVVKTVTDEIEAAMQEKNDIAHLNLTQVWIHANLKSCIHCIVRQAIKTWFQNEAQGVVQGPVDHPVPARREKRGHPASSKAWSAKTVCGNIFSERVDEEQRRLTGTPGGKDIAKYNPALGLVFEALSADELARCETLAEEWNAADLPEEVLRKYEY